MKKDRPNGLIIAGGGTGGHLLAGISVVEEAVKRFGPDFPVLFVGAFGGIEERLVPKIGYPLRLLRIGSLNRVSLTRKLKTYYLLPWALLRSIWILITTRPAYVLGVGGYASGPIVLMAKFLRMMGILKVKIGILEQNAIPGFTNRILGQFVDFVFAAFPGTESSFPKSTVLLTGNPIRSSMTPMYSASRNPFTLFIFGGSQGAIGINTLILHALPFLADLKNKLRFIHQTGERDFDRMKEAHQQSGMNSRVEKYIENMASAYSEASLVICRTGSSTLAELAAVGRAALLIPLPTASDNHQEWNAKIFADRGASILFLQQNSTGEGLAQVIRELVNDTSKIEQMEAKVKQFHRPGAAFDVLSGLTSS